MAGPLSGLTIVELAGIGPGPMCSMMLGDMGADVIRVDRTKAHVMDRLADPKYAVHNRSRRSVSVDLQKKEGVEVVLRLIEKADGITEPFRPGVAERRPACDRRQGQAHAAPQPRRRFRRRRHAFSLRHGVRALGGAALGQGPG